MKFWKKRDGEQSLEALDPLSQAIAKGGRDSPGFEEMRTSRFVWRCIGLVSLVCVAGLSVAFSMIFPLKEYETVVILVDKTTGYMETVRTNQTGPMKKEQAVLDYTIGQFVLAREAYDSYTIKRDFDIASLLSTGAVRRDLENDYAAGNKENKIRRYGRDIKVVPTIKSIAPLNDRTALVRFSTEEQNGGTLTTYHWVATVRFTISDAPKTNKYMLSNPLGFQVVDYTRKQENVEAEVRSIGDEQKEGSE